VSNSGEPISWADFARAIFKAAGVDCHVKNIPSSAYPTAAKRPAYSLLDISDYESRFSPVPAWYNGLTRALSERDI
jgi:dTDP-4-dehydrorhamnose reductase